MVEGKTPWLGVSRVERVFAEGTSRGGVKRKSPNHGPVPRDVLEVVRVHVCVCDSVLDPLALLMTFTLYFAHPMLCSPCLVISDMVLRKQRLSLP